MATGILLLRLTIGLTLAAHGSQKVFGWFGGLGLDQTGEAFEAIGFHPGRRHAMLAGLVEVGAGVLLAVGCATWLAAAVTVSVMMVAAVSVHWRHGFFVTEGGYEFNVVFGAAALTVAFTGPGAYSLDAGLGWGAGGEAPGLAALVLAVIAAGAQLSQRRVTNVRAGQDAGR